MKKLSYRQIASKLMIAIGTSLILLNLLGYVLEPKVVEESSKSTAGAIEGYSYSTQDTDRLQKMLDEPVEKFDIDSVNNTIYRSIAHSNQRRIEVYENWLLWLAGKFYEPLSRTQFPQRVVAGGAALCSEVSAVFNRIASINKHDARFVGLNGHVVSEVRSGDGWRVVDPDYGVTYPVGLEVLETREGAPLMRDALAARGYSDEVIDRYIQKFQTTSDNTVSEVGVPLSPRLYLIERSAEYLKWIIPAIFVLLGIFVFPRRHAPPLSSQG